MSVNPVFVYPSKIDCIVEFGFAHVGGERDEMRKRQSIDPYEIYAVCKACGEVIKESSTKTHEVTCKASKEVKDHVCPLF